MTFDAREHVRQIISRAGKDWSIKDVQESMPYDLDDEIDDFDQAVKDVQAALESAQVTVTFPTPAACCPHCPHREEQR